MRRLFWVALGASVGAYAVYRVNKAAKAYTPEGLGNSLSGAVEALRDMADAVREGMAEREQELRVALGVDAGTIGPQDARALLENPSAPSRDR